MVKLVLVVGGLDVLQTAKEAVLVVAGGDVLQTTVEAMVVVVGGLAMPVAGGELVE